MIHMMESPLESKANMISVGYYLLHADLGQEQSDTHVGFYSFFQQNSAEIFS